MAQMLGARGSSRTWVLDPRANKVICYKSTTADQIVTKLVGVERLSPIHDENLAKATKEINSILTKVEKTNDDPVRELSFLNTHRGLLLVWAETGAIGSFDDDHEIDKALGLV